MSELKTFDLKGKIKNLLSSMKENEQKVLTGRCGLDGQKLKTLKLVGDKLSLTRERVRQIEKRAFEKILEREEIKNNFKPIYDSLAKLFDKYGGLVDEQNGIRELALEIDQNGQPFFGNSIKFILRASGYLRLKKSLVLKPSWTNNKKIKHALLEKSVSELVQILKKDRKIMGTEALINEFKETGFYNKEKKLLTDNLLLGILYISRPLMKVENTENWGLVSWSEINPKTIHDWTYYVVKGNGKPVHFTKIGELINSHGKKKDFNLKTVHNVLIADKRFVLVGNGLYALREWGYQPGTVFDVIKRILEKEKKPLTSKEITEKVMEERQVKPNTVLVNLQNKETFKRIRRATYTLVSKD